MLSQATLSTAALSVDTTAFRPGMKINATKIAMAPQDQGGGA
jgi:hypothetical protein